jgi:AraC-like DNA-binding protein
VIDTAQKVRIMGVHFKPGGAHAFTGFAVDEVQDRHLAAEVLWGAAALTLTDQLAHAPDAAARFLLLEEALHRRVVCPAGPHAAVQEAVAVLTRTPGLVPIESLAAQTGLSHRRFIELFRRQAGLPPKLFSRILRFQQTLARVHAAPRLPDWCEVAFDAGYYDQSHLIRDFRQFAGLTPAAYYALKGEHKNHVPVPVLDGDGGQICPIPEG